MAESSATLCRFFANNCCRNGDQCHFSHDRTARVDNVCRYYLRGVCSFGASCRYDHIRPSATQMTPEPSSSSRRAPPAAEKTSTSTPTSSRLRSSAPEFVPKWKRTSESSDWPSSDVSSSVQSGEHGQPLFAEGMSFAAAVGGGPSKDSAVDANQLCPYFMVGQCYFGDNCGFVHGLICDMCDRAVIHPTDTVANSKHHAECVAEHERAMEAAFAEARSADKQCGICMDVIVEKKARFGILQNCRHCFCLDCIRKWRKSQQFENKIVRSCPECRTHSDYIIPCVHWVEDATDKEKLITEYKSNTAKKLCKYFKAGNSEEECPFGNKCFYRHELPDGTVVKGDSPRTIRRRLAERQRRQRRRHHSFVMWDFFRERHLSTSFDSDDDRLDRLLALDVDFLNGAGWSDSDDSADDTPFGRMIGRFEDHNLGWET
uniref:RING-type E3 ubiquitin transferase n=1 Tax=Plectus sambesii TaxID=2011161 RepID=A0A914UT34_9BILA